MQIFLAADLFPEKKCRLWQARLPLKIKKSSSLTGYCGQYQNHRIKSTSYCGLEKNEHEEISDF